MRAYSSALDVHVHVQVHVKVHDHDHVNVNANAPLLFHHASPMSVTEMAASAGNLLAMLDALGGHRAHHQVDGSTATPLRSKLRGLTPFTMVSHVAPARRTLGSACMPLF